MKLTNRELWLMRQAFNDGVCDENFDTWLNEGTADGVTVADVLAKDAPPHIIISEDHEVCAAICPNCDTALPEGCNGRWSNEHDCMWGKP